MGYYCNPRGQAQYDTSYLFSVTTTSNPRGRYYSYINGLTDYSSIHMYPSSALLLGETAEWSGDPLPAYFTVSGTFANVLPWQRWNGTSWINVQSAYLVKDEAWHVLGGPPGSWFVDHAG